MGVFVTCGEITLWQPSLDTGRLFAAHVQALERIVGGQSGISEIVSDEIDVDQQILAEFIERALARLAPTNNRPLLIMCAGCLSILMALHNNLTGGAAELPTNIRTALLLVGDPLSPIPEVQMDDGLRRDWTAPIGDDTDQPND